MTKPPAERRYDHYGEFRLMVRVDGYVMARRPRATPRVFSEKEWDALSRAPVDQPRSRPYLVTFDGGKR